MEVVHNLQKDFPGKLPFHLTSDRNFRIFWLNGKHPTRRSDPQRFMGRNVNEAHFNADTVACTSPGSIYSESKHGNQNTAFFSEKGYR